MSNESKKTGVKHWFKGLQSEFNKISWPDREKLQTETTTVAVVAVVLGVIIATVDMILQYGINFLV